MREIRTLRAMWRVLETELRKLLTGHEGGNAGHSQGVSYESVAPALDPTRYCAVVGGCGTQSACIPGSVVTRARFGECCAVRRQTERES